MSWPQGLVRLTGRSKPGGEGVGIRVWPPARAVLAAVYPK